jgi:5'-nucleotidase
MKRVLVDMDGVLADVYHRFLELHEADFGIRLSVKNIIGLKEAKAFPNQLKWVNTPGFFRSVPVMHGSQNGLMKLNERFEVIVVSMATEFPESLTDKQLWLIEHYPFISWKQIVFCGCKDIIQADIMIDDHLKNLDNFKGETIMFTQPHNINITDSRHKRVDSWPEIEKLLLIRGL